MVTSRECVTVLNLIITVLTPDQPNILVNANGRARIVDFRFATVIIGMDSEKSPSYRVGSEQWSAPEVLKDRMTSKKTDIFSFAMVMIEARCR